MRKKLGFLINSYTLKNSPTLYYLCESFLEHSYSVDIFINSYHVDEAASYQKIGVNIFSPHGKEGNNPQESPQRKSTSSVCFKFLWRHLYNNRISKAFYRRMLQFCSSLLPPEQVFALFNYRYGLSRHTRQYAQFLHKLSWDEYLFLIIVEPEGLQAYHYAKLTCPFIYLSLELNNLSFERFSPGTSFLKMLERRYIPQALFTLIQDKERESIFREDNRLSPSHTVIYLPVSVRGAIIKTKTRYFREKFHIPDKRRIVLYAGSIEPWTNLLEIVESTTLWKSQFVLVIHGGRIDSNYLAQLETVARGNSRIFISTDWVDYEELDSLVSSGDIGISSYADTTLNNRLTLYASGKIATYLKSGLPLITNSFTGIDDFFQHNGCGEAFENYEEIASLLLKINGDYATYKKRAYETFLEHYCFDSYFRKILPHIEKIISSR